jgi:hypothetical protein
LALARRVRTIRVVEPRGQGYEEGQGT